MNRNGRSAAEERALRAALRGTRLVRTRVQTLTLDGDPMDDLTDLFIDGQVNVHTHRPVTRSLQLALADPGQRLPFDSASPGAGAMDFKCMLQVGYDVYDDDWVESDVFTGPVRFLRRRGGLVHAEALGKEKLALTANWRPFTLPQRMKKTDAIVQILTERIGETSYVIPDLPARLPKPVSLGRQSKPWQVARRIAHSMGMQLFYDGSGVCRLRHPHKTPQFTFTSESHVKPPGVRVDKSDQVINAVYVFGGPPKGSKTHVTWPAIADRNHPLSPWSLARNGVPSYRAKFIHDDLIRTVAEARTVAERELFDGLMAHARIRFESQPCGFFIDPLDLCQVEDDATGMLQFRMQRYSFPLATGPANKPMPVGYVTDLIVDRSARR